MTANLGVWLQGRASACEICQGSWLYLLVGIWQYATVMLCDGQCRLKVAMSQQPLHPVIGIPCAHHKDGLHIKRKQQSKYVRFSIHFFPIYFFCFDIHFLNVKLWRSANNLTPESCKIHNNVLPGMWKCRSDKNGLQRQDMWRGWR